MRLKNSLLNLNRVTQGLVSFGISLILSLGIASCQSQIKTPKLITVPLDRVVSGQTVEIMLKGATERVRIIGIDVPPEAKQAAQAQLQQILGSDIIDLEIVKPDKDRYDRILAHIWQDDKLIAEELAKIGYALANTKYPNKYRDRIWHAQEYARILDYGIWQD